MNQTEMALCLIPVIGGVLIFLLLRKEDFFASWISGIGAMLVGIAVIFMTTAVTRDSAVQDYEIVNGSITGKKRSHGTYEESYDCNCKTVTTYTRDANGRSVPTTTRKCETCYRTHYTVSWDAFSTIGSYDIDSRDKLSRSVYDTPDPARYTSIAVGDPVSSRVPYKNYVKAVPDSLFAVVSGDYKKSFLDKLPPYPERIYDYYRIDRFVPVGISFPDAKEWNEGISKITAALGVSKQVNLIVVVVKETDQRYALALRDHWEGVNKNDVVVVLGTTDGKDIAFASVLSWTKREIFMIQLQDSLRELGTIDRVKILSTIQTQIVKNYERRRMRDFEYLKDSIPLPVWVLATLAAFLSIGYVGAAAMIVWTVDSHRALRRKFFPNAY